MRFPNIVSSPRLGVHAKKGDENSAAAHLMQLVERKLSIGAIMQLPQVGVVPEWNNGIFVSRSH